MPLYLMQGKNISYVGECGEDTVTLSAYDNEKRLNTIMTKVFTRITIKFLTQNPSHLITHQLVN
jgi:hypothetical protein